MTRFESKIYTRIWNRINEYNKNWLCIVTGATGSGKSYSALKIAQTLDPNFSINNVVFTPEAFMQLITNGIKKGSIIIFDEAGVGMPSREWYSISNKMLSYVLQTFRFMNLGVIFTTPSIGFIDTQARRLFHTYIETNRVDRKKKRVKARIKDMEHNPQMDKIYYKNPRKQRNEMEMVSIIYIGKPDEDLVKAYEKKKNEECKRLFVDIGRDIQDLKVKVSPPMMTDENIISKIINELNDEKITIPKIQALTNISYSRAAKIRSIINHTRREPSLT